MRIKKLLWMTWPLGSYLSLSNAATNSCHPDQEKDYLTKGLTSRLRLSGFWQASLQSSLQYPRIDSGSEKGVFAVVCVCVVLRKLIKFACLAASESQMCPCLATRETVFYVKQDILRRCHHCGRLDPKGLPSSATASQVLSLQGNQT